MRLFIAEKPSLGKGIAAYLQGQKTSGDGYVQCGDDYVTWAFGHIFEQAAPDYYLPDDVPLTAKGSKKWRMDDLPIFPEKWVRKPKDDVKAQIKVIRDLLKKATVVVNAGDPDREGQLLIDEILEELGWKGETQRIWLAALDEQSVKKALANLKDNREFRNLSLSAEARSRADWLTGMNLTRAFSLQNKGSGVLSVGRVQTPTLSLIATRDDKIEHFKPKDYYVPQIDTGFWTTWVVREDFKGVDIDGYLTDKSAADTLANSAKASGSAVVKDFQSVEKKQAVPLGFSLAELQKACSAKFGMSAQSVLNAAQALYETHKATSYPRSDCRYLPEEQFADAGRVLAGLAKLHFQDIVNGADANLKSGIWNTGKVSAHHAIIPTGTMIGSPSADVAKVYDLIVRVYVAQFYPEYVYQSVSVVLQSVDEEWKASANTPVKQGWKAVYGVYEDKEDDDVVKIPSLKKGQPLVINGARVVSKQTKAPARFTDGTLIGAMSNIHQYVDNVEAKKMLKETSGLGTEATRASILETLIKRGFIVRKGKQLVSTDAGRALVKALPAELTDPVLTAQWEDALAGVADGRVTLENFEAAQKKFVLRMIEVAKASSISVGATDMQKGKGTSAKKGKAGPNCPACKKPTTTLSTKAGNPYYKCDGCQACWWPDKGNDKKLGKKWEPRV